MLIPVLISITVAVILITILLVASSMKRNAKGARAEKVASSVQRKGIGAVVKEYEKKLAHDPHNIEALNGLGQGITSRNFWRVVNLILKQIIRVLFP